MEELTIDQAVDMMNGVNNPVEEEKAEDKQEEASSGAQEQGSTDEVIQDDTEEVKPVETPTVDFSQKVKFKANGQEVEKSIQELINDAQLASNYNQKMQELAMQRKAFDASLQQQQQIKVDDPAQTFEELNNKITTRAMKLLGITNAEEFAPDPTGILGSKVHHAAYQQALLDIQQEKQTEDYAKREQQEVEQFYVSNLQTYAKEKDFQDVNKYAEQALFALPQKGAEGIAEFNEMYQIYQNLQLRDQQWLEVQQFGKSNIQVQPLTRRQVDKLTSFYEKCKTEYSGKQTKEQVKSAVPKGVVIKPTVKVESNNNTESAPTRKTIDLKKIREMDIDDVARML